MRLPHKNERQYSWAFSGVSQSWMKSRIAAKFAERSDTQNEQIVLLSFSLTSTMSRIITDMKVQTGRPTGEMSWSTKLKKAKKKDVETVPGAFVVSNVCTGSEAQQYIDMCEHFGFTEAPLSVGIGKAIMDKSTRDNERVMWDCPEDECQVLWERLKPHFPTNTYVMGHLWEACGLNERFRFYRCKLHPTLPHLTADDTQQVFAPHFDGCFPRNDQEVSHFTLLIYLSEGFEGGHTNFFPGRDLNKFVSVDPRIGQALAFWHVGPWSPLHEGAPHFSEGLYKYVLRSDVMYRKVRSLTPEEKNQFECDGSPKKK